MFKTLRDLNAIVEKYEIIACKKFQMQKVLTKKNTQKKQYTK